MLYLLDTNVLIHVIRGNGVHREFLRRIAQDASQMACSVITVAEIHAGMRDRERTHTMALFDALDILPVTSDIAALAGDWKLEWASRGVQLTLPDLLIAATASKHGATLVTGNAKDFPQKGLKVLSPAG